MTARPVYRDYDQRALDAQYNNRARFPHYRERFDAWAAWSARTRGELPCHLDVAFGEGPKETLDLFPVASPGAPVYVFVHGGYWYSLDKRDFSYVARGMAPHGVMTVVTNYALAPDVDMDEIVRQNRAAIAWLGRHVAAYGGDPSRIYLCGHSAGGHLVCMTLATDWATFAPGLPRDLVKGACAISGLFDLEPIRLSYLNETLKLTAETAARHSPLGQRYPTRGPLLLVVGADESEEYHRQTDAMAALWRARGAPVRVLVPPTLDHFSVVDSLIDPAADLVKAQLADAERAFRGDVVHP